MPDEITIHLEPAATPEPPAETGAALAALTVAADDALREEIAEVEQAQENTEHTVEWLRNENERLSLLTVEQSTQLVELRAKVESVEANQSITESQLLTLETQPELSTEPETITPESAVEPTENVAEDHQEPESEPAPPAPTKKKRYRIL